MVQATLAGTLAACLSIGALHKNWLTFSLVAWAGCGLHLLLDSLQDKWGNGVHLLAPFDWSLLNLGIVEIESTTTAVVTVAGLLPFLFFRQVTSDAKAIHVDPKRLIIATLCAAAYLLPPTLFVDDLIASNSRYLATLQDESSRIGKTLELDREHLHINRDSIHITTHTGELLTIDSPPAPLEEGIYSVRATFVSRDTIRLSEFRQHSLARDFASYAGLALIGAWCLAVIAARLRRTDDGPLAS